MRATWNRGSCRHPAQGPGPWSTWGTGGTGVCHAARQGGRNVDQPRKLAEGLTEEGGSTRPKGGGAL